MKLHLLVGALVALPLVAFAGPKDEAKKHIAKATEAHQQGKYDLALTELEAAYKLDPQPDLLYAIGQVHVKLGRCPDAIASYEKFLATKPPGDVAALAQEAIDTCKAQTPAPEPPPPQPPPPQPPPPTPEPEGGKPFYTDVIGDALVGAGVISSVLGVVFYTNAVGKLDEAEATTTYAEHEKLVGDARGQRNLAIIFGAVGVVAIGVGVWHFMQYSKEQSKVAIVPTTDGGMVTWQGRF